MGQARGTEVCPKTGTGRTDLSIDAAQVRHHTFNASVLPVGR
jgi:hypothetical protein